MVSVIIQRCSGALAQKSAMLYASSVAVLLIYGIIASAQLRGGGAVLAWSNVCAMLLLDVLHYLLGRGGHHWAPGLDVALLATGMLDNPHLTAL
jgi:hypothetical protein